MANWNDLFGGGGLIMPSLTTNQNIGISLKNDVSAREFIQTAAFWTVIDVSKTDKGYETVSLSCAADTSEQTIVDTTSAGVLTHVISPALSASGIITIRVTIDGAEKVFTSPTLSGADLSRYSIGHFIGTKGQSSTTLTAGLGSGGDSGHSSSGDANLLTTPIQALMLGTVGMVFKTSLKVTIQGSVNITATAEQLKALAAYATAIPEGL